MNGEVDRPVCFSPEAAAGQAGWRFDWGFSSHATECSIVPNFVKPLFHILAGVAHSGLLGFLDESSGDSQDWQSVWAAARTSKWALSRISKPAAMVAVLNEPIWKSATRQVRKPAPRARRL